MYMFWRVQLAGVLAGDQTASEAARTRGAAVVGAIGRATERCIGGWGGISRRPIQLQLEVF